MGKSFSIRHVKFLLATVLILLSSVAFAQTDPTDTLPDDPAAMRVYKIQDFDFGALTTSGAGGTLSLSNNGVRSNTGGVVGLNWQSYYQSIFEIDAPYGSNISIVPYASYTLTRSGGGGSMTLVLNTPSTGSIFTTTVNQPARTEVKIGGTLTVGSPGSAPPGTYTGTVSIMFYQE